MPDHDHSKMQDHAGMPMEPAAQAENLPTAIDPVCGMTVTLKPDRRNADFGGATYHFCSEKCQTKFGVDPYFYASGNDKKRGKVVQAAATYTCPMHPEIIRDAPGSCPICGMALEPVLPSDAPSPELAEFTQRLWISAGAAVPLLVLTMGDYIGLPLRDWIGMDHAPYVEFVLATPIVLWAALPFFRRGWESVLNRSPNMWTLI